MKRRERTSGKLQASAARDVDEEIAFHIDMRVAELVSAGMAAAEARSRVEAEFGDIPDARAQLIVRAVHTARRRNALEWIQDAGTDARYAWRSLLRRPGFAVVAVLTLCIGIGATTALFTIVNSVLLRPLPYARPEALVQVWPSQSHSVAESDAIRSRVRSFEDVAAYDGGTEMTFRRKDGATQLNASRVTSNLVPLLGVTAMRGHAFTEAEVRASSGRVAVLSAGMWQREFGSNPRVIGSDIYLQGLPYRVTGVMSPTFQFPKKSVDVWVPLDPEPAIERYWGVVSLQLIARLRAGASESVASREVAQVALSLRKENPLWTPDPDYGTDVSVTSLKEETVGDVRSTLLLLFASVTAVFLIVCVNIANLLLARGAERQQEMAIRSALGARGGRLARQLLAESAVIAAFGGAAGLFLAFNSTRILQRFLPSDLPRMGEVHVDVRVMLFGILLSALAALGFGIVPALTAIRTRPSFELARSRSAGMTKSHRAFARMLVVAEVALAVLVVICGSLLARSLVNAARVDPGFRAQGAIVARIAPPQSMYETREKRLQFYTRVLDRVQAVPGVTEAGIASQIPFDGFGQFMGLTIDGFTGDLPILAYRSITPHYLSAIGTAVTQGRAFEDSDRKGAPRVAIVDAAAASKFWPGQNPIGKRVRSFGDEGEWTTIVGVASAVKNGDLGKAADPTIYFPYEQVTGSAWMRLVVRTSAPSESFARTLRQIIRDEDPWVALTDIEPLQTWVSESLDQQRFTTLLLTGFAIISVLLGALGIYGVNAQTVNRQRREIGVRIALGAAPRRVLYDVMREGALLSIAGGILGLASAFVVTRLMQSLLFDVSAHDPAMFMMGPLVLIAAGLTASFIPGRRASNVDPLTALRAES